MSRPVVLGVLWLGLAVPVAPAQTGFSDWRLSGRTALDRVGLERQWSAAVPLASGSERVLQVSLAGQGVSNPSPGHVHNAPATAIQFAGRPDLATLQDYYTGLRLRFTGGALAGRENRIVSYAGATRTFRFEAEFPAAPADGDPFEILGAPAGITGRVLAVPVSASRFMSSEPFTGRSSLSAIDNEYRGSELRMTTGALRGQRRRVAAYMATSRTFRLEAELPAAPAADDDFEIVDASGHVIAQGSVSAGSTTGLIVADDDSYLGSMLVFTGGDLAGEGRTIVGYDAATQVFRFDRPFSAVPEEGAPFRIQGGIVFAQTNYANLHAFDAESGRYLWGTNLGRPTLTALPVSVNPDRAFVTSGKQLFCLDRQTGRQAWSVILDDFPASPTTADDDIVLVGLKSGKVSAYTVRDLEREGDVVRRREGRSRSGSLPPAIARAATGGQGVPAAAGAKPGRARGNVTIMRAGTNLFNRQTDGTVTSRPVIAHKAVAFASGDSRVYVVRIFPPKLVFRFLTAGPIAADLGALGTRTLLAPSGDNHLYALDLYNGATKWIFPSGHPILQSCVVAGNSVFVINDLGDVFSVDAENGSQVWARNVGQSHLLALTPTRIYLATRDRGLMILDRATGKVVADPRSTIERAGLDIRGLDLPVLNGANDRIYLGSGSGLLLCLREANQATPAPLRDPRREAAFGLLPEDLVDLKRSEAVPVPAPAAEMTTPPTPGEAAPAEGNP